MKKRKGKTNRSDKFRLFEGKISLYIKQILVYKGFLIPKNIPVIILLNIFDEKNYNDF
jgi:hypothetical protein